jgi:hypothetical protein
MQKEIQMKFGSYVMLALVSVPAMAAPGDIVLSPGMSVALHRQERLEL